MKVKYFTLPNILTLLNLLCGCVAVMLVFRFGYLQEAFWFVMLGALFDFFDGFAARLLKQYSPLGKQLDSLADMVTFGLAPAAMVFVMMLQAGGGNWSYVAFLIPLFSALRLAKFNIDEGQSDSFIGLPTPANAIFFAALGYLWVGELRFDPYTLAVIVALMSWLLIGPIRMFAFKFKDFSFRNNSLRYIFILVLAAGLAVFSIKALPAIIILYVFTSVATHFACRKAG